MKWDTLWILRIHKLLQKKSILDFDIKQFCVFVEMLPVIFVH